jgi:hypothetical protein
VHGADLDTKDIDHRLNSEHECTLPRLPRAITYGYLSLYHCSHIPIEIPCLIQMQLLYPVESIQLKLICQLDPLGMVWSYTNPDPLVESSGHIQIASSWTHINYDPLLNPNRVYFPHNRYHHETITYNSIETHIGHIPIPFSWTDANSIPYSNPVDIFQLYPLGLIPIQIPLLNPNAITLSC